MTAAWTAPIDPLLAFALISLWLGERRPLTAPMVAITRDLLESGELERLLAKLEPEQVAGVRRRLQREVRS